MIFSPYFPIRAIRLVLALITSVLVNVFLQLNIITNILFFYREKGVEATAPEVAAPSGAGMVSARLPTFHARYNEYRFLRVD